MGCYLLSVKITQWIFCVEMATYRGANQIGDKIAEQGIVKAVKMAYQALVQMMTNYCGFNRINEEMEEEVITWQEVKEMPKYPNEGSIRKVRGVIVVKLQETAERMSS